ncbi:hypothetical protein M408DRAFT_164135 [Serendipita vermifera MAFF 305830]|uniref:Uncharacterized protein n=1 Tax=Serendipita vermifera MAFF 305830 TaxID=933852 RepID=A0A0C3B6J2_SERVB|nr:hypothetical protein M408DRAFT_164135 [Serendipita vermifera MAFF 305830]
MSADHDGVKIGGNLADAGFHAGTRTKGSLQPIFQLGGRMFVSSRKGTKGWRQAVLSKRPNQPRGRECYVTSPF